MRFYQSPLPQRTASARRAPPPPPSPLVYTNHHSNLHSNPHPNVPTTWHPHSFHSTHLQPYAHPLGAEAYRHPAYPHPYPPPHQGAPWMPFHSSAPSAVHPLDRTARPTDAGPVALCTDATTRHRTSPSTEAAQRTVSVASPPPPTRVIYVPTSDDASVSWTRPQSRPQSHAIVRHHRTDASRVALAHSWDSQASDPWSVYPPPPPSFATTTHAVSPLVYDIRETDVLCGRGAPSLYHSGNQAFRHLVDTFQSQYIAARRMDKPEIASHIVAVIRTRGGRFLKRTKVQGMGPSGHFGWQDIGEQRAYEKACQALREGAPDVRRKLAAQEIAAAALCSIGTHVPSVRKRTSQDELVDAPCQTTARVDTVVPTKNSSAVRLDDRNDSATSWMERVSQVTNEVRE